MYAHLFQNPLLAIAWRFKSAHWYHLLLLEEDTALGSTPYTGDQHSPYTIDNTIPSAMGHHSYSVIFKVSKTIRSSRYHFHFVVEAFGDAVVPCKAPHCHYRL